MTLVSAMARISELIAALTEENSLLRLRIAELEDEAREATQR